MRGKAPLKVNTILTNAIEGTVCLNINANPNSESSAHGRHNTTHGKKHTARMEPQHHRSHAALGMGQVSPEGYKAKNHGSKGTPSQGLQTKKVRLNSLELSPLHTFPSRLPPPLRARDFVRVLRERASVPPRGPQASIQLVTTVK